MRGRKRIYTDAQIIELADKLIAGNLTSVETAEGEDIKRSTVWNYMNWYLKDLDEERYCKVRIIYLSNARMLTVTYCIVETAKLIKELEQLEAMKKTTITLHSKNKEKMSEWQRRYYKHLH